MGGSVMVDMAKKKKVRSAECGLVTKKLMFIMHHSCFEAFRLMNRPYNKTSSGPFVDSQGVELRGPRGHLPGNTQGKVSL
jgi:hypothetical protein